MTACINTYDMLEFTRETTYQRNVIAEGVLFNGKNNTLPKIILLVLIRNLCGQHHIESMKFTCNLHLF